MSMFHIGWMIALFAIFVAIVFWAFSRSRKADFDEAARLPLENNQDRNNATEGESSNG